MQAISASRLRFAGSIFAVSDRNNGAVLKGFMIGNSAPIVSAMASLMMLPSATCLLGRDSSLGAIGPIPE